MAAVVIRARSSVPRPAPLATRLIVPSVECETVTVLVLALIEPTALPVKSQSVPLTTMALLFEFKPPEIVIKPLDPPVPAFSVNGWLLVIALAKLIFPLLAVKVRVPAVPPTATVPPPFCERLLAAVMLSFRPRDPALVNVTAPVLLIPTVELTVPTLNPPSSRIDTEPVLAASVVIALVLFARV